MKFQTVSGKIHKAWQKINIAEIMPDKVYVGQIVNDPTSDEPGIIIFNDQGNWKEYPSHLFLPVVE